MLISLVLQLQAPTDDVLPATLGRAGQALLLRLIREWDAALAEQLHNGPGPRPYTVSNLVLGKRAQGSLRLEAGQTGWLRFTGLTAEVSGCLQALAAQPPELIDIDGHSLRVTGATLDPAKNLWAGQTTYQDLAAPYLLGGAPNLSNRVQLEFVSPTSFRSNGQFVPLPLPELVFGSLLDRWQQFAPIALHPETRRFAAEAVVLNRYTTRTRGVPYVKSGRQKDGDMEQRGADAQESFPSQEINGRGGEIKNSRAIAVSTVIGFTGQVAFAVLNRDRYWLNVLHLLAAFAFYSGVGYQTGTGLGQVRVVRSRE